MLEKCSRFLCLAFAADKADPTLVLGPERSSGCWRHGGFRLPGVRAGAGGRRGRVGEWAARCLWPPPCAWTQAARLPGCQAARLARPSSGVHPRPS